MRYWDLTEKQRSELSYEEIEKFLPYEYMESGVVNPVPPVLEQVPEMPIDKTEKWYKVGDILFAEVEEALQFLQLEPHKSTYDYRVGYKYDYAEKIDAEPTAVMLFDREEIRVYADSLKKIKDIKEKNEQLENEYTKEKAKSDKVRDNLISDWRNCQAKAEQINKINKAYNEYIDMAGSRELALFFLGKIYSAEEIQEAQDWYNGNTKSTSISDNSASSEDTGSF